MHGRRQAKIQIHIESVHKSLSLLTFLLRDTRLDDNYSLPIVFYPMVVFIHTINRYEKC